MDETTDIEGRYIVNTYSVLNNNHGYKMICTISEIISGEEKNMTNLGLHEDMTLNDFLCFKYE